MQWKNNTRSPKTVKTHQRKIHIWYLEICTEADINYKFCNDEKLSIYQAKLPSPELSRYMYTAVGGEFFWVDRLPWNRDLWQKYLDRPELETWIASYDGTPAGFFELELQADQSCKITYFGLIRQFFGKGLGGHLLSKAVERAWEKSNGRIWVHTCDMDHEHALENYKSRGFKVFREGDFEKILPTQPVGSWKGSNDDSLF
ncbi:MAG: GNAT family N-acetyltransferase [Lentisphaeria bacterium]|nr:GNAT family N-acetyltransferase [Lentisphaeria bacterium]NQZ69845.1 GNAT family N-acetyltransferase [Lentisphaeria bacterium]